MNLILLEPHEVSSDGRAALRDGRAVHIRTVLGAAVGDRLRVGVVDGPLGEATVTGLEGDVVALECRLTGDVPRRGPIDLVLAVPRPKVLRRLWAQLAAMGVHRIVLTNAERVERPYFDTHFLDPAVVRPLLLEGLQQARDTQVPLVSVHRRFRVLVEDDLDTLTDATRRVVLHPGDGAALEQVASAWRGERVCVAIGPEGGWNAFELELLRGRGFVAADLGPRTLRTDTACVAVLAVLHAALRLSPASR